MDEIYIRMDMKLMKMLAINQYPDLKRGFIIPRDLDVENNLYDKILSLIGDEDYDGAKVLINKHHDDFKCVILELIIYFGQIKTIDYQRFKDLYDNLLDRVDQMNEIESEYRYRFLRLLSGWLHEYQEYELSKDVHWLSDQIGGTLDRYEMDCLMNRWISQNRIKDLKLIKGVIDHSDKVDHYLSY